MPITLLLVLLSAAAPGPRCDDVPSCVAVSSEWRIDLGTLLQTLPVATLLEGWSYEHPDAGKRASVHRSVVEAISTTSEAPRTEAEARALLELLFTHPAEFTVHTGASILRALSKGEWRSLLDGCAGFEGLARECALWAALEGSRAPRVVDTLWALYLADELDSHRGLEAFCALPPVVARFRSRMEELARSHAPLRPVDARLLITLDEAWSQELLENRVKHRSPDMAREAVQALVDDIRFDVSPRLRRVALWRAAKEPAFERQRQAATAIAGLSSFTQEEQRTLIEVARSSDEFRDRAAAALVSLAHLDADARKLTLAALLARPGSEARESPATRLVGATSPRNSAPAWSAAVRESRTVCWLIEPLREWMRSCDLASAFDANTLNQVAAWVRTHWRIHDLNEVRVDPSSLRGEERVRTLVLDDGSELHLRLGPVPDARVGMQPEERERTAAARRALHERLVNILEQPPRHGRGARCGAAPTGPRDHSTLPTRPSSSPPELELRSMDRSVLPPVEVRDGGGHVVAWASGVEHPARRAYRNSSLVHLMRWTGAPVLVYGWWRGTGRYELAVAGEARPGATLFDVTTDTALVRVAIEMFDGMKSEVLAYRRGRSEVTVRVTPSAAGLEVTITNGTRDALLPEAGTWRSSMQLDYERRGWTAAMLGSISESPDPMLAPGQSHTFVLASPKLLPPARWRLSFRYEVDGLAGQRFVTSPVIFDSPPGNSQFGPEETRGLVAVASGVLGLRGQTVVHHDGGSLPKVRVDAGTHLAGLVRDDSRALVAAFGKALFVSSDGGSTFDRRSLPDDSPIVAGAFAERELVVVTADRKVMRRRSEKWREEGRAPGPARRLVFADALRGWMVLEDNSVQATTDGGRRWKPLPALEGVVQTVAFDGTTLWAAGSAGVARLKGSTWNFVHRGPCQDVAAAHDTLVAACEVPLLVHRDSALSRAPLSPEEQHGWVAVDVTPEGFAVLAGSEGLARMSAGAVRISREGVAASRVWLPYLSLEPEHERLERCAGPGRKCTRIDE